MSQGSHQKPHAEVICRPRRKPSTSIPSAAARPHRFDLHNRHRGCRQLAARKRCTANTATASIRTAAVLGLLALVGLAHGNTAHAEPVADAAQLPVGPTATAAAASPPAIAASPPPAWATAATAPHMFEFGSHGWLTLQGLLQTHLVATLDDNDPYAGLGDTRTGILLRRLQFNLLGSAAPKSTFFVSFDLAKVRESVSTTVLDSDGNEVEVQHPASALAILQDFILTFSYLDYLEFSIGQALLPISGEGLWPSDNMLFVERSEVGRFFGDNRDIGIWAHHRFEHFSYLAGVYQGGAANSLDNDAAKEIRVRLELAPTGGLLLAAAGQQTVGGDADDRVRLVSGTFRFTPGLAVIESEFHHRKLGTTTAMGGYLALAFWLFPDHLQPALRIDWFDPNTGASDDDYWRGTIGLNYEPDTHWARFQLNYIHSDGHINPNDLFVLNGQIAF